MPKILTDTRRNEAFLASEASGHRSRDVVALKAGRVYEPGSVLGLSGDAGPVTYALADVTDTKAVVLCRAVDATEGAVEAAVIARDAEVKSRDLVLATGTTLAVATAALAANGIVVRTSI